MSYFVFRQSQYATQLRQNLPTAMFCQTLTAAATALR
eukprot:CAMPEP_0182507206 /NCGR_PEP_ID=MMETSP1321-20130603/22678_1 /TAXON_ID=91990 /ORGANISM="Bolidomonas sp., Strain RCC1657" /LENGTH=36 /DNA_ID= /DNA_START= /DNA_END= /DNA_ORIENTATION=